jgi:hypothetical protein
MMARQDGKRLAAPWIRPVAPLTDAEWDERAGCCRLPCDAPGCRSAATWIVGGRRGGRRPTFARCDLHARGLCITQQIKLPHELRQRAAVSAPEPPEDAT